MDIYLMQHGVATPEEVDPARPLTAAGRAEVEKVAAWAGSIGLRAGRCAHSGKLRAEQTTAILAPALGAAVELWSGLAPGDDVVPVAERLRAAAGDPVAEGGASAIAVVGHLPFLDRLASVLVTGDARAGVVAFRNAALVRLTPADDGARFRVALVVPPDALP